MDIQLDYTSYSSIVLVMFVLFITLWTTIIPYETIPPNKTLLYEILFLNLLFAIALFLLLYVWNSSVKQNIIQLSLVFTFLVALPCTLYNLGVTTLIYSNKTA
jgi:hypothetical protein